MVQYEALNADALIENAQHTSMRRVTFAICFIVAMLDGYDTQAIAFVAPVIAKQWGISVDTFGPVFAIGLLGLTIGALAFGPIADRYGRKPILFVSTAIFGAFGLMTVLATTYNELLVYRLLTGIGLGGAMPNVIALTSEYFPRRIRTTAVTLMFTGFPIGAVIGGIAGGKLIAAFGWHSIFVVGGVAPLVILPLIALWLPESIRYLLRTEPQSQRVQMIVARLAPLGNVAPDIAAEASSEGNGVPIRHLFADGRSLVTLLLWVIFFVNLLILYFLINWLPTVMTAGGMPLEKAIVAIAMLNLGGVVGGFTLGRLIDRFGPFYVLSASYVLATISVSAIGQTTQSIPLSLAVTFVAGFFVIGCQFCANALAAESYPTFARSTGVGWALGIGRIGSIVGPLIGGLMVGAGFSIALLLVYSGLPALLAALAILLLAYATSQQGKFAARPQPVS
jgi:AAHS family 4-hydroxybenzoate transporter-like MFS transporter